MELIIPESANPVEAIERFAADDIKRWDAACDQFLKWERASMLLATPSSEVARQHRAALLLLLRFNRAMFEQVQGTNLDSETKGGLASRLRQLQASWNMFYDPIKESQAIPSTDSPKQK